MYQVNSKFRATSQYFTLHTIEQDNSAYYIDLVYRASPLDYCLKQLTFNVHQISEECLKHVIVFLTTAKRLF